MSEALLISVGKGIESARVKKGKSKMGPKSRYLWSIFDIDCRRQSERFLTVTLKFVCRWYRKTDSLRYTVINGTVSGTY